MQRRLLVVAATAVAGCHGHAILTVPVGRPHPIDPQGAKMTPFADARRVANLGCGGTQNHAVTTQIPQPSNVFVPGQHVHIKWKLTVPHNADNEDTGIRVAIHYEEGDSFECNILAGGLVGDPGFKPIIDGHKNPRLISAGPANAIADQEVSTIVKLPNKTCEYCVLQWTWAARQDGGFYISCADIAIVRGGIRPRYETLPSEAGNELPKNQPKKNYPCTPPSEPPARPLTIHNVMVIIIVCLLVGLFVIGAGYYFLCGRTKPDASHTGTAIPPPPPDIGVGGGGGLAPGWTACVDPASRQTYYLHENGESTWTKPLAPVAMSTYAAMPPPPPASSMPPNWQSHVDPSSGDTFYQNSLTGEVTWDLPGYG